MNKSKETSTNKYVTLFCIVLISLAVYAIMGVMYMGFIAFRNIFMVILQPVIIFLLFLYIEELMIRKKLGKFIHKKSFYICTLVIPIVICALIFTICNYGIANNDISIFGRALIINAATVGIFAGIKLLMQIIIKKIKKVD